MEEAGNAFPESSNSRSLREQAVRLLARQHAIGICHQDVHLENLLVAENTLYSIDASALRVRNRPLGKRASLANLGLFLGQFFPKFDSDMKQLLDLYAHSRGWDTGFRDLAFLHSYVRQTRDKRRHRFLAKIYREGSVFGWLERNGIRSIYNKQWLSEELQRLLLSPQQAFSDDGTQYIKRGNTSTLVRATIDGRRVVIKRYNIKGRWHGLRRALRRTRASISWHNAHLLRFYGIDTPTPIAMIERRVG
ncbi:MAG: hypothetical protein R3268_01390, partial [Acidiferrobacterales bacterium]|nr:hypothetical protein [Acidiferrobacterales bacterium]